MRCMILTGLLLISLSASAMAGQVYTWTDEQGMSHFSGRPPIDQASSAIDTTTPGPQLPVPKKLPLVQAKDLEQKALERKVRRESAIQGAERSEFCETVRTDLTRLENNPRLRVQQMKGEIRRLSEEERQARITDAKRAMKHSCR
ncbi:DUF4124 domain-containing protein [Azorhizophilus paspali]|uniref:DUF4124 domain-containing protein n=1 Tax=Azorhizophilus paspali TaxID=69963 RepID=A0ABV6SNZ6_AZOPA